MKEQFVILGGTHDGTPLNGIFGFKNNVWSKLGTLNQARYQHSAISNGREIMVVGGLTSNSSEILFPKLKTEVWNIEFSHNRTIEPELSGYHFYPELCLVPYDFSPVLQLPVPRVLDKLTIPMGMKIIVYYSNSSVENLAIEIKEVMNDWKRFNNVTVTSISDFSDSDNETSTRDKGSV